MSQRNKYNKEYWLGSLVGLVFGLFALWLWDKIIAWAFNGGINISTVFNLNSGFMALCLLALVGIAYCLWLVCRSVLWIIKRINHRTYHQSSGNRGLR